MTNEEIDKMMSQLEKLKTPEPKGVEIPDCGWLFNANGKIDKSHWTKDYLENGNKRTTIKACELAAKRMIRINRLSLLAHILGVECEFVEGELNHYVFQTVSSGKWKSNGNISLYYPDRVYMTKEGAKSVATILNNDEWSLEIDDDV